MDHEVKDTRQTGLRVVAVFEGAKGGLVLISGYSWPKLTILAVNLAIVAYLAHTLTIPGRPPRNPFLPNAPRPSRKM